jgi:transposase
MSLDGILHLAIQDHPYTAVQFNSFVDALLDSMNPFPQPNSVIVMDNASIHKSADLLQMVEERYVQSLDFKWLDIWLILNSGMRLLYLSPYSPDFNPIEEAFSCIKAWIRLHRDQVLVEMEGDDAYEILWEAVFTSVTVDKVQGWFGDCGYL